MPKTASLTLIIEEVDAVSLPRVSVRRTRKRCAFAACAGRGSSPHPLGRERRRVTVLFIDLVGFSALTRDYDPEKLRDFADEILTVIAGIVEDFDGYVDAFQGDGLIALFGAPRSHPDDAERAVLAAAAGLRAVEAIGRNKGIMLKGRAGINTGTVIAGTVGTKRVKDYTVMGSAVNLAARLEAAASPGEVWVGEETFEATRHRLYYAPSPPLKAARLPRGDAGVPLHRADARPRPVRAPELCRPHRGAQGAVERLRRGAPHG